jgi:hypothetical protein
MRLHRWAVLPFSFAVAFTSGCVQGTPFRGELTAAPSPVLELSWAKATRTTSGIVVLGQIQQAHCCARTIPGYLHVEAKGLAGDTIAATDTKWGDFIARQLHSASFKTLLAIPKGAVVSRIVIEFDTPVPR